MNSPLPPPIAIGGLGGSGTRVFAAMLRHAGVDIGPCLNQPLDNLWFTVLFKRHAWSQVQPDPEDIATSTRLFTAAMTRGLRDALTLSDRALIAALRAQLPPAGDWKCGARVEHADALLASPPPPTPRPWGWKEPNTHIFLNHLVRLLPGLRYIHIVRDGLDMAFSANTWQARHWSHLYGLEQDAETGLPLHQLRYWTAANRAALVHGARMPGRFLVVRYEAFCANPTPQWHRVRRFLGASECLALPLDLLRPTSIGRSAQHDLSTFPEADLAAARTLQSDIVKAAVLE